MENISHTESDQKLTIFDRRSAVISTFAVTVMTITSTGNDTQAGKSQAQD